MRSFFPAAVLLLPAIAAAEAWFIPAAANAIGANGTSWRTEAVIVNPGSVPVCANFFFLEAGKDNSAAAAHPLDVPAGRSVTLDDLVGAFFAAPGKTGAVRVEADGPLVITTRTFNDLGDAGTYGQGIPALSPESAVHHGETQMLYPLMLTGDFRTNIGLVNTGSMPVRIKATFYDPEIAFFPWPVGMEEWDLSPMEYLQVNDVLAPYWGGPMIERAFAVVSVETPGGSVLPWTSIVDNHTGDPVFAPGADRSALLAAPQREWVRVMGGTGDDLAHAVACADDGGIWVAGESDSAEVGSGNGVLMKVDAWGRVIARRSLFSPGQTKIFGLHALAGGGAVLCGASADPANSFWSGWAMALSGTGEVWWSRMYHQPESAWLYGIVPMTDGTYRTCGQILPSDGAPADAWVMALDSGGGILWQRRLAGVMEDWLYAMVPMPDGGMAAAGATRSFGGTDWDAWLVKLDGAGEVLGERIYGGPGQEAAYGIGVLPGGDFLLAGQTDSWGGGGGDLWLFRADPEGGFKWGRALGSRDWDTAYTLAVGPDGRILTAGQRGEITAGKGDAWIVEWDGDGGILAQSVAGGPQPERLYGAAARANGGWLAAGRTESAGSGGKDLLLLSLPAGLDPGDPCSFMALQPEDPIPTPTGATKVATPVIEAGAAARSWIWPGCPYEDWTDRILCGTLLEGPFRSLIPAAARTNGSYGTRWKTDLFVRLPAAWGIMQESARIAFLRSGRDNSTPPVSIVTGFPGDLVRIADVLETLFGEVSASGALLVEASGPVEAWTVTYTRTSDGGTRGQGIPAFTEGSCLKVGESALLPGLVRTPGYRTNVGFAGPGSSGAEIAMEVYASDGTLLGTRMYALTAAGQFQMGDFLGDFGERIEGAYAAVRSSTPGACYFAYASVVDNRTGDPVFIHGKRLVRK